MYAMTSTPIANDSLCYRTLADETIILANDGTMIHVLDEMGTEIFELFDGRKNLTEVLDAICARWDVSRDVAESDLLEFVTALVAKEIVSCKELP